MASFGLAAALKLRLESRVIAWLVLPSGVVFLAAGGGSSGAISAGAFQGPWCVPVLSYKPDHVVRLHVTFDPRGLG